MIVLSVFFAACDTSAPSAQALTSRLDGKPVVTLSAQELMQSRAYPKQVLGWAAQHGDALVQALNNAGKNGEGAVGLQDVAQAAGKNQAEANVPSSHLLVQDRTSKEQRVLGFRRLNEGQAGKALSALSTSSTYLILDPDYFYDHDDAAYREVYPFSVEAVSLSDGSDATVTFSGPQQAYVDGAGNQGGEIVYLQAEPACDPWVDVDCESGGGGGGGTGGGTGGVTQSNEYGNSDAGYVFEPDFSSAPASTSAGAPWLILYGMQITGTEAGAEEAQLYISTGDDYATKAFGKKRKYDFDKRTYSGSYSDCGQEINSPYFGSHSWNRTLRRRENLLGASYPAYYEHVMLPDINVPGVFHYMGNVPRMYCGYGPNTGTKSYFVLNGESTANGVPLADLSKPDVWRMLLTDDDDVYSEFSTEQSWLRSEYVSTYDMATYAIGNVLTKINSNFEWFGSSDDIAPNSGIRNMTKSNVESRYGQAVTNGFFTYDLGVSDRI